MLKLKELMDLLAELPPLCGLAVVAAHAAVAEADVLRVVRESQLLGYVEARRLDTLGVVVCLTPLGAERLGVVTVDVRILKDNDWHEEPRWMPLACAWWLLRDAAHIGYPVEVEEGDEPERHQDVDRNALEPIEYLIANEEAEKRRAIDGSVLPYPLHFYGLDVPCWPVAVSAGDDLDERRGLACDGTDGPCPVCGRSMTDPVGYCVHCDAYGHDAQLPRVTCRPAAHRAQLHPRCTLAGGRGPSKTIQRFRDRNKGNGRAAG